MVRKFKTGDLVLCKVGSFPPWPAVVFPQRLLRSDVYRKRRPDCIAVCFFSDPTYYWEQPQKLRPLEPKMIESFLLQENVPTSQEDLLEAYREAQHFSNLNDFIVNRLKEEDRLGELKKELDKETVLPGEDPFMSKADSRRRNTTNKNSKNNGKRNSNGNQSLVTDSEDNIGTHSGSSDMSSGDNIKKRKKSKLDQSRRVEISLLLRRRLQQNLIQRDLPPSKKELLDSHRLLDKILANLFCDPPFFDIDALRESKLHKLLKVIVNDPDLKEFHSICKEILVQWVDIIAELKSEKSVSDEVPRRKQRPTEDRPTAETTIV